MVETNRRMTAWEKHKEEDHVYSKPVFPWDPAAYDVGACSMASKAAISADPVYESIDDKTDQGLHWLIFNCLDGRDLGESSL